MSAFTDISPYTVVPLGWDKENRGHLGSVYTFITESLNKRDDWKLISMSKLKKGDKAFGRYHLLLAEAQGRGIHYGKLSSFASIYPGMRVLTNYYRGFQCICRKAMMVQTLRDYYVNKLGNADVGSWFIPETYAIYPAKREDCERESLYERVATMEANSEANYWILKPSDGLKGNRIKVMEGLDAVRNHIEGLSAESVAWVASRYLHNPALVRGDRKFDIRCWVLLDQKYNMYLYREGVLRTAAPPYSMDNLDDIYTHLSNHCIAVNHPDYGKYEPTNELWFSQYDEYLLETTGSKVGFYRDILPTIKDVIAQTLEAARPRMCPDLTSQNFDSFEIFGFDLALTDDYRVYLLEVNSSPAVADELLPRLAADLIELVIDNAFEPQVDLESASDASKDKVNGFIPIGINHKARKMKDGKDKEINTTKNVEKENVKI